MTQRPAAQFDNTKCTLNNMQRAYEIRCLCLAEFGQPTCALANFAEGPILFGIDLLEWVNFYFLQLAILFINLPAGYYILLFIWQKISF